jgi:hypothetical protein
VKLDETAIAVNDNCARTGVKLKDLDSNKSAKVTGFLLVSCVREDRMLYVNVLKPADLNFAGPSSWPIRVAMRPERTPLKEELGQLALTDGQGHTSFRYDVTFESEGPIGFRLAFGFAPAYYSYNDNFPNGPNSLRQLDLMGTMSLGYLFAPGHWEIAVDAKGTLTSFMMSANPQSPADWYSLSYSLGYLIPVKEGEHTFGVYLGWEHYFMTVSGNTYGLPRQGLTNIAGPLLTLNMRFHPLGRLGWTGYFKYAPLSDQLETLEIQKFQHHDITVGAAVDLPWLEGRLRRPAVFVEGGFGAYSFGGVDMSENHVMLGLLYPIR